MTTMIPKAIHYIWLGEMPMHPLMIEWRERWASLHPSWTIEVWKEIGRPDRLASGCKTVESRHPAYLKKCPTLAKRSDVWRYDLLEQLGGLYLDADFEPLRNIEPIVEGKEAFAGKCWTMCDWSEKNPHGKIVLEVGCSLIGATAHHPWLRDLESHIEKQSPARHLSLAFPYITKISARHPEIHLFEPDIFYPMRWDEGRQSSRNQTPCKAPMPAKTYAVHQWSSNWFENGLKPLPP